jgi:hypothetical protein
MSVRAFQAALADLVGSPRLCLALREDPQTVLDLYELTARERERLEAVVRQPGMSTQCTLHRSNRITPIYTLLPSTCLLLGEAFGAVMQAYWDSSEFDDLQFKSEVQRFGRYLGRRIDAGEFAIPLLDEVLEFELAWNELRFVPRRRVLRELGGCSVPMRMHPLVRLVRFSHEPEEMLGRLARRERPPYRLPRGDYYVQLSAIGETLEVTSIFPRLGRRLVATA